MSKSNETTPNVPTLRFCDFIEDWTQLPFGLLATYKKGPFGSALTKSIFVPKSENTVKVYEQQNAINKDWTLSRYYITNEYYQKMKSFTVHSGDIIVSCAGTIGESYVIPNDAETGIINQALMIIRTNEKVNKTFYLYLFNKVIKAFSEKYSNGSAIKNIPPFSDLKSFRVAIPTIEEQNKISMFLSLIDDRITVQNKIISDLKVLKKELCNRYFKSVHNNTSLGYVILKDILTERKEYCSKDGTYTHGTLSKEGVSPKTERYDRDFLVKNEDKQYKVTHFNDICYNPANLKFGVICRNTYGDLIFSPIYVTFEIADTVYPAYIELFLTNANFIGRIRRYEQGTVYERMAVSSEDFLSYETRIPTYEEQVKFADKIQRIQDKIELETLFLNSLQKQRKYLLNAMFI